MLVTKNQTTYRKAEGVELWNYLTATSGTSISVAFGNLNGQHPESISPKTDRCYIFISGEAKFTIEDDVYFVGANDVIYVAKGKRHAMEGKAKYYIINNPPYQRK